MCNLVKIVLILSANPTNTSRCCLGKEVREIEAGLERARKRNRFILVIKEAVRPIDIHRAMLDYRPQIVHFCGHGAGYGGLAFENEVGKAQFVEGKALANLFALFASQLECVVLNACYSEIQANAISQHINYVIGMGQNIGNEAAIKFAVGFYDALGAGDSFEFAYQMGRSLLQLERSSEYDTPVIKKKPFQSRGKNYKDLSKPSVNFQIPLAPSGDRHSANSCLSFNNFLIWLNMPN